MKFETNDDGPAFSNRAIQIGLESQQEPEKSFHAKSFWRESFPDKPGTTSVVSFPLCKNLIQFPFWPINCDFIDTKMVLAERRPRSPIDRGELLAELRLAN